MHTTPLRSFHLDYSAKLVEFTGWEMPMMYTGIHEEHNQVRTSGGFFDVSHMGRVKLMGRHARRLLERVCSRSISSMQIGQCRYSLICNERGGVMDDVIVMRRDDDEFLVVVNASNREKIVKHLENTRDSADWKCKVDDQTFKTAMIALQGPKVMETIERISKEIPALKRYRFTVKNLLVMKLIVSRTGYTGEDGVEIILPSSAVGMAMKLLLKDIDMSTDDAVIKPAGLGARDSLRLEAGMPLYGHELGEDINALPCGIDFALSLDKDEGERGEPFIGMEALKKTRDAGGPQTLLVGLTLDGKRTARQGNEIKRGDEIVGTITSACMSPTLGVPIAMGFVQRECAAEGTALSVDVGRSSLGATVTKMPFYKAQKK